VRKYTLSRKGLFFMEPLAYKNARVCPLPYLGRGRVTTSTMMVVRASTRGVSVVLEGAECGMASAHGTAGVTAGKGEGSRGLRSKLSLNATKSDTACEVRNKHSSGAACCLYTPVISWLAPIKMTSPAVMHEMGSPPRMKKPRCFQESIKSGQEPYLELRYRTAWFRISR
jgi:hypothetical protein